MTRGPQSEEKTSPRKLQDGTRQWTQSTTSELFRFLWVFNAFPIFHILRHPMKGLGNVINMNWLRLNACSQWNQYVFSKWNILVRKSVRPSFALAGKERVATRSLKGLQLLTPLTYKHIPFSVIYGTAEPLFLYNCYYQKPSDFECSNESNSYFR